MSAITKYFEGVDMPEEEKVHLEMAYEKVFGIVKEGVLNTLDEQQVPEGDIFKMLVSVSLVELANNLKSDVKES
jgi:hypothetical protein